MRSGWIRRAIARTSASLRTDRAWADGVVTPHAAFLAMMYEPAAAFDTLARL